MALSEAGYAPLGVPERNRSTILSVPVGATAPRMVDALAGRDVVAAARDGNLRFSVHVYNHEDDITRLAHALAEI